MGLCTSGPFPASTVSGKRRSVAQVRSSLHVVISDADVAAVFAAVFDALTQIRRTDSAGK
jgi:hypothetical protein